MANESDPGRFDDEVQLDPLVAAWANQFRVARGQHEFMIEFLQRDAFGSERTTVVAKVAFGPAFLSAFKDEIDATWRRYSDDAMPKEVDDGGSI